MAGPLQIILMSLYLLDHLDEDKVTSQVTLLGLSIVCSFKYYVTIAIICQHACFNVCIGNCTGTS